MIAIVYTDDETHKALTLCHLPSLHYKDYIKWLLYDYTWLERVIRVLEEISSLKWLFLDRIDESDKKGSLHWYPVKKDGFSFNNIHQFTGYSLLIIEWLKFKSTLKELWVKETLIWIQKKQGSYYKGLTEFEGGCVESVECFKSVSVGVSVS